MASSYGPAPSQLTLLTHLPSHAPGAKVRFLGCVSYYDQRTCTLELQHPYPETHQKVSAMVNIRVISGTLKREDSEVGAWLNVLGYIANDENNRRAFGKGARGGKSDGKLENAEKVVKIHIDAILLWDAGPLQLSVYEEAVACRMGHNYSSLQ